MPALLESAFFPSRPLQRLEKKTSLLPRWAILDLDEATGEPRLTTADLFGSEPRNGLLCADDPVDRSDPMGLDFTAEIQLRENLDNIPDINPIHNGGTTGNLSVRAQVTNGKIVFQDVDIHATSYVRTRMRISNPFVNREYNRGRQDIARTVKHEGLHLVHHENYYGANKEAIRKDFQDGRSYTKQAGEAAIAAKTEAWRQNYRNDVTNKGKELDQRTGFSRDTSTSGNDQTPSGTTGPRDSSAAAVDAALMLSFGVGGGLEGEGFHPRGPR